MWRRLNDREPVRPIVFVNEEPWAEAADELKLTCADPFLRNIERELRVTL